MSIARWFRRGQVAFLVAGSAIAVMVACSDDATTPSAPDGGTDAQTVTTPDAAPDVITPELAPPVLNVIHASPDIGAVVLCFESGGAFAIPEPLPSTGLLFGTGGRLAIPAQIASFLPGFDFTPYVLQADTVAAGADCATATAATTTTRYQLPVVKAGTLLAGHSYIAAVLGCGKTGNAKGSYDCGDGYGDGGANSVPNLHLSIIEADPKPSVAPDIGAQFLQLSPQLGFIVEDQTTSKLVTAAVKLPIDAGADAQSAIVPVGSATQYLTQPVATPTPNAALVVGARTSPNVTSFQLYAASGATPATELSIGADMTTVALASTGVADAGYFEPGGAYTFIAVGDPTIMATSGKPNFFRFIALKTSP